MQIYGAAAHASTLFLPPSPSLSLLSFWVSSTPQLTGEIRRAPSAVRVHSRFLPPGKVFLATVAPVAFPLVVQTDGVFHFCHLVLLFGVIVDSATTINVNQPPTTLTKPPTPQLNANAGLKVLIRGGNAPVSAPVNHSKCLLAPSWAPYSRACRPWRWRRGGPA